MILKALNSKEQHILNVAESIFLEYGYHRSSIRLIAERAGINNAMLHYYFFNKENLFKEVVCRRIQFLKEFDRVADTCGTSMEQIIVVIEENRAFFKLMIYEHMQKRNSQVVEEIYSYFSLLESRILKIIKPFVLDEFYTLEQLTIISKSVLALLFDVCLIREELLSYRKAVKNDLLAYVNSYFKLLLMKCN